jgi:hypothetical protein
MGKHARSSNQPDFILNAEVGKGQHFDDVVRDALHLRHHGQAQGRLPDPREPSSPPRKAERQASIKLTDRGRTSFPTCRWPGSATTCFPMRRRMVGRLHHQLPRVGRHGDDRPARDRPDLLLRPAARVRKPADFTVMIRMEDAGALKRSMFHYFMAVAKRCAAADILDRKPGVSSSDRLLYCTGRSADLRAAAQCAGHEPDQASPTRRAPRSAPTCSASTARSA